LQLAFGIGGPADERRAFAVLKPLCERGLAHSCAVAGDLLLKGKVMRNHSVARSYLRLACSKGQTQSCAQLRGLERSGARPAGKAGRR
jgi:TPR repeat protein